MTLWLVQAVGEADLGFTREAKEGPEWDERARQVAERLDELSAALADDDVAALRRRLAEGRWDDAPARRRPALAVALEHLAQAADGAEELRLLLLGVDQTIGGAVPQGKTDRDTGRLAELTAHALRRYPELMPQPLVLADPAIASSLGEDDVVRAMAGRLEAADGDAAVVIWGSGATSLVFGAATAVTQAGLPLRLLDLGRQCRLVDPLADVGCDPVVRVLLRWRMFAALARASARHQVSLTTQQRTLIGDLADRWQQGYRATDADTLRGVVADAVVRRDGTAGIAVRRYVPAYYQQLLDRDGAPLTNLLTLAEKSWSGSGHATLGKQRGWLRGPRRPQEVRDAEPLPSTRWLLESTEVVGLLAIGNRSHRLEPPTRAAARCVGEHLRSLDTDAARFAEVGLPAPPVVPGGTVLAAWAVGIKDEPDRLPVGQQLLRGGLGERVLAHVDQDEDGPGLLDLRAVLVGTLGDDGSLRRAETDAAALRVDVDAGRGHRTFSAVDARAFGVPFVDQRAPDETLEELIAEQVDAAGDVAVLVLVPTGPKGVVLPLLRALRLVGARRGIPLVVRETHSRDDRALDAHLWPALAGGDRPLLVAARSAVRDLELDVAWRLLAATSCAGTIGEDCRALAAAFACRPPSPVNPWPPALAVGDEHCAAWTLGLAAQRLALVAAARGGATGVGDETRLLVLASGVIEASVARSDPALDDGRGKLFSRYRDDLRRRCRGGSPDVRDAAWVLEVLHTARDEAPITHGDALLAPDDVVRIAVAKVLEAGHTPADAGLPRTVGSLSGLFSRVVRAADVVCGRPPTGGCTLQDLHAALLDRLETAIAAH